MAPGWKPLLIELLSRKGERTHTNAHGYRRNGDSNSGRDMAEGPYKLQSELHCYRTTLLLPYCASAVMIAAISCCMSWRLASPLVFGLVAKQPIEHGTFLGKAFNLVPLALHFPSDERQATLEMTVHIPWLMIWIAALVSGNAQKKKKHQTAFP